MLKNKKKNAKKVNRVAEKKILLKFLKRTKSGGYATVEKTSIPYSRISEQTEVIDQVYYYGLD